MTVNLTRDRAIITGVVVATLILGIWAFSRDNRDPEWLRREYGITNAFSQEVETPEGTVTASLVPVKLSDNRTAYLVVPHRGDGALYLKDGSEIVPVTSGGRDADKERFVRSAPLIVQKAPPEDQAAPQTAPRNKRSTQKEVLIVAGSAGTGAAIGGIAGGKKGAAIGAISGGVAGLVYDLATRNR